MATPLNTFKTITAELTTSGSVDYGTGPIYTTPAITSAIVLMAQVSNVADIPAAVTASHYDPTSGATTEQVKNFVVPVADAVGILVGKLVLTAGQQFYANASADGCLKLTLSILESK